MQHFEAAFDGGSEAAALAHEFSDFGVVDEVVEEVTRREGRVGQGWCDVCLWKHAEWSAVDDDGVVGEEGRGDVGVGEGVIRKGRLRRRDRLTGAADVAPFDAEFLEAAADGLGGSAGAEDEGFPMVWLQEWADAVHEANNVGVETFEVDARGLGGRTAENTGLGRLGAGLAGCYASDSDDIHCTDGAGFVREFIKQGDDGLLMGQGDVEPTEVGVFSDNLGKHVRRRQLEVEVGGIDAFVRKLLSKECTREGVAERIAKKTVFFHFVAKYMVERPKVNRWN